MNTKVALFADVVESEPASISRYATELLKALSEESPSGWEFEKHACHQIQLASSLIPGRCGQLIAERAARFLKYPLEARKVKANIYHILDNGHANLGLVLPPLKTVITCHDLIALKAQQGLLDLKASSFHRFTTPLRLRALKQAGHLIAISHSTKKDLVDLVSLNPDDISVIHHGVSPNFRPPLEGEEVILRKQLIAKRGLPDDAILLLHVSGGAAYKNSGAVFAAVASLNNLFDKRVYLLRVGADFTAAEQTQIHELGIKQRVFYEGFVLGDEELRDYYWLSDVFVFPSLYEGFGWPPLEALACGASVVVSNVSSLPEVVGEGALLIEPTDIVMLVQSVSTLIENAQKRAELRSLGLKHASNFTWERAAKLTLAVYEKMLSNKREFD